MFWYHFYLSVLSAVWQKICFSFFQGDKLYKIFRRLCTSTKILNWHWSFSMMQDPTLNKRKCWSVILIPHSINISVGRGRVQKSKVVLWPPTLFPRKGSLSTVLLVLNKENFSTRKKEKWKKMFTSLVVFCRQTTSFYDSLVQLWWCSHQKSAEWMFKSESSFEHNHTPSTFR